MQNVSCVTNNVARRGISVLRGPRLVGKSDDGKKERLYHMKYSFWLSPRTLCALGSALNVLSGLSSAFAPFDSWL